MFNCYMHWAKLLLFQPGDAPLIILIKEGVMQGDPLSVVLYGINLTPLAEELRDSDPTLLSTFYSDDVEFGGLARRSAAQLRLLIVQKLHRGYFLNPAKSISSPTTLMIRRRRGGNSSGRA